MIVFKLGFQERDLKNLKEMVKHLSEGKIAAIPTETFYALSANPFNEEAVQNIFTLKGRSVAKPILLLISSHQDIYKLASDVPDTFELLARAFWPGPLTLIMKSSSNVPHWIDRRTGKIGVRIPGNPLTCHILKHCPFPLTGTSANRSGDPPLRADEEVIQHFKDALDCVVLGGKLPGGPPSTLLDISEQTPLLLREGRIKREELEAILKQNLLSNPAT